SPSYSGWSELLLALLNDIDCLHGWHSRRCNPLLRPKLTGTSWLVVLVGQELVPLVSPTETQNPSHVALGGLMELEKLVMCIGLLHIPIGSCHIVTTNQHTGNCLGHTSALLCVCCSFLMVDMYL